MHVGGICVFEGHVAREAVVERVRERVHLIPRYAMRLDEAPLGLANPAVGAEFAPADVRGLSTATRGELSWLVARQLVVGIAGARGRRTG